MKLFYFILFIISLTKNGITQIVELQLQKLNQSITEKPTFLAINPQNDSDYINYKTPPLLGKNYTTSRFIYFKDKEVSIKIPILIIDDSTAKKIVIIDKDFDLDFTNDKFNYFFYDSTMLKDVKNFITVDSIVVRKNNQELQLSFKYVPIKPRFININYKEINENDFFFMIGTNTLFITKFSIDDKVFQLILFTKKGLDYSKESIKLAVLDESVNINEFYLKPENILFALQDTIALNNQLFEFYDYDLFKSKLILKKINRDTLYIPFENFYLRQEVFENLNNKKSHIIDSSFKFTLLEFWGTWCKPCKEIMPKIKKMASQIPTHKLRIIGVAYDDDKKKVIKYIRKNGIKWNIIYAPMKYSDNLIKRYKVEEFPTYFLIDNTGKIVLRAMGKEGFGKIEQFVYDKLQ